MHFYFHFSLELISGLNRNHMKDDFSKTAAFQNLSCTSNPACLVLSYCFYQILSELLQTMPCPLCCPYSWWIPCKPPHDEGRGKGLVKRSFHDVCHPSSVTASGSDCINWLHGQNKPQSLNHENYTGYDGFNILKEKKYVCSKWEELQNILLKYKTRSLLWQTHLHFPPSHFIFLVRLRKRMAEG